MQSKASLLFVNVLSKSCLREKNYNVLLSIVAKEYKIVIDMYVVCYLSLHVMHLKSDEGLYGHYSKGFNLGTCNHCHYQGVGIMCKCISCMQMDCII